MNDAPPGGRVSLRVLILEDTPTEVELLLHELQQAGFEPQYKHVETEAGYREHLGPDFDLIIADYRLPQFNALEALQILQERKLTVPFIVVTASISEEAAVSCMKTGATDYLLKDRLARLGPAIRQALEGRKTLEAKLSAEAETRRRNRELSLLNRIIAASTGTADESAFLQAACTETAQAMDAFLAAALTIGGDGKTLSVAAEYSSVPGLSVRALELPPGWGAMIMRLRAPAVMDNLGNADPVGQPHAAFIRHKVASIAIVPIVVDSLTVGALGLFADAPGHFVKEREELLHSVADELSSALARKRQEHARLLLGAAVDQSADAVLIFGVDGMISYVNEAFERLLGRTRADVVGKPPSVLADKRPDPGVLREISSAMREGRDWWGRMAARGRDGRAFTADLSFSPVRDRRDAIACFLIIARDITRSLELEDRYLQAQKMEAIGRLAGSVAHDFNNLLTSIMGFAELLSERLEPGTPAGHEIFQIRTAAGRAAELTRQLLAFGRRQVLVPRVSSLNQIVSETELLLRPMLRDGVELVLELEPRIRQVMADPGQIGQVIMNLVLNARDAMAEAGGRIVVATSNVQATDLQAQGLSHGRAGDPCVALRVTDNGSGISPEALPRIFEPFFTTKRKGKGTGLGLAIVFGIIRQSGGSISVTSEPGKGTTFEILLPAMTF